MGRGPELDPQTRARLCELKSIGMSYNEIHKRYPHIPLSTITSTVRLEKQRQNNVSRPRAGAPRKLTEEQRDRIYELVTQDPYIKYKDLLAEVDHVVQTKSIKRLIRELGLRKKTPARDYKSNSNSKE